MLSRDDLEQIEKLLKPLKDGQDRIQKTQQEQGEILQEHTGILHEHTKILHEHSQTLHEHSQTLHEHSQTLHEHSQTLHEHTKTLHTQSTVLGQIKTVVEAQAAGQQDIRANVKMVEATVVETRAELKTDILAIDKKLVRKVQNHENRIEALEEKTGTSTSHKN